MYPSTKQHFSQSVTIMNLFHNHLASTQPDTGTRLPSLAATGVGAVLTASAYLFTALLVIILTPPGSNFMFQLLLPSIPAIIAGILGVRSLKAQTFTVNKFAFTVGFLAVLTVICNVAFWMNSLPKERPPENDPVAKWMSH
jgi:hypothetical protein